MASRLPASAALLAARTVHIKLYPIPHTFPERREVLRVLERYGEVVHFRSLKYAPRTPVQDAFFAIFATQSAADDLLSQSPLRYKLVSSPQSGDSAETVEQAQPTESIFQLDASKTTFNHELFLNSSVTNPLHGPFIPDRDSPLSRSLEFSLPTSITSAGMADWSVRHAEDEGSEYLHRRAKKADPPKVMKGLRALSEQTQQSTNQ